MNSSGNGISRRSFLKGTLAAGAGIMGCRPGETGPDEEPGFIDSHSHVWRPDADVYPLSEGYTVEDLAPPSFTPEELFALARPQGVDRVVLIQHSRYHLFDNRYLTDVALEHPGIFSVVAIVDPRRQDLSQEIDRLRTRGVRGLRIRPGDGGLPRWTENPGMRRMWAHGAEVGVALCPLITPSYLAELDRMCERFPDTTVVVDHFARVGQSGTVEEEDLRNLERLARFPNTYVKVSAFYYLGRKAPPHDELIPMIRRVYDAFGPERLMWGSDCPYQLDPPNTYESSIGLVRDRIDFLTDRDRRSLLRETAERVFFSA
jgi:L-fuconolactonase